MRCTESLEPLFDDLRISNRGMFLEAMFLNIERASEPSKPRDEESDLATETVQSVPSWSSVALSSPYKSRLLPPTADLEPTYRTKDDDEEDEEPSSSNASSTKTRPFPSLATWQRPFGFDRTFTKATGLLCSSLKVLHNLQMLGIFCYQHKGKQAKRSKN